MVAGIGPGPLHPSACFLPCSEEPPDGSARTGAGPVGYGLGLMQPIVDLKGERQRDAYAELWRLVLRRPARSQPWRDVWKVWLVGVSFTVIAWAILGTSPFTLAGLAILAVGGVVTWLTGVVFRRVGVIADYRAR